MNNFTRNCKWCSSTFETNNKLKVFCSRKCLDRRKSILRKERTQVQTIYVLVCRSCKNQFTASRNNAIFCGASCRHFHKEDKKQLNDTKKWQAANRPLWKARIFYRDKGICQLCLQPIDLTLDYPNPMSYSIDHKIPRSLGGTHEQRNLQASHLVCNVRRGNKPIDKSV